MEEVFSLNRISYAYPYGQPGLQDVTLSVREKEQIAVLGANASGKSTLLQLLDGLLFASSGMLTAFGTLLSEETLDGTKFGRFFRQQTAFLFQNVDAQLFCPSVEEELAFGPRHMGVEPHEIETRVEDMLTAFRLSEIRHRSPNTLSGGEKRRVGLAAVLAPGPSVVLLDEPTSGLDPRNRAFVTDALHELAEAGKTIIVATHDLELARDVTNRAVVLTEDHRLAADAPTEAILEDMNLLRSVNLVHVHAHRHGRVLHAHPHSHAGSHEHEHET